eukprot:Hpha_TRINITY_DN16611_c6_g2::TRINITY_DN16611_c6_g2_i1::g.179690::m.179690
MAGLPPLFPAEEGGVDVSSPRKRAKPKLMLTNSMVDTALSPGETWTPAPGRVCVVLDFDLTLARIHVYKELRKVGFGATPGMLGVEEIFGGSQRFGMMQKFLERLHARRAYVAVLTNNSEEVVLECLALGGLSKMVDLVISVNPSSTKGRDFSRLRPPGVTRWVFADDDSRNIRSVERETRRRVPCIQVDGGEGLQQRHIDAIEAAAFPPQFTLGSEAGIVAAAANASNNSLVGTVKSIGTDSDYHHHQGESSPKGVCRHSSQDTEDEEDGDEQGTDEVVGPMMRALSVNYLLPDDDLRLDGEEDDEEDDRKSKEDEEEDHKKVDGVDLAESEGDISRGDSHRAKQ